MIVSNDFDGDTSDALARQLVLFAHNKDENLTHREILTAYIGAIGDTLASIPCRGCREAAARLVKSLLPDAVSGALEFAAENDGDEPPTSGHVH